MGKKLFSYNPDVQKNAYLNWRTDTEDQTQNLYVIAADYADAAITLINVILEDNRDKKADALIMPILYCIDQSIELYMKAIIRCIEELNGDVLSKLRYHDIEELKRIMVGRIKKHDIITNGLENHLAPVTLYIDDLYQKIKGTTNNGKTDIHIDFARYPFSLEGVPHFYIVDSDNVVIDVENLSERFVEIRSSLEEVYSKYESEKQTALEQRNE